MKKKTNSITRLFFEFRITHYRLVYLVYKINPNLPDAVHAYLRKLFKADNNGLTHFVGSKVRTIHKDSYFTIHNEWLPRLNNYSRDLIKGISVKKKFKNYQNTMGFFVDSKDFNSTTLYFSLKNQLVPSSNYYPFAYLKDEYNFIDVFNHIPITSSCTPQVEVYLANCGYISRPINYFIKTHTKLILDHMEKNTTIIDLIMKYPRLFYICEQNNKPTKEKDLKFSLTINPENIQQ